MKDLDQKIIELMDLFDDEQITTADQIDRPERAIEKQAIDDFVKRNPMAGGGMLVQPGFGGMRQGYKGNSYSSKTIEPNIRFRSGKYETSYKGESLGTFEKITDARKAINKAKESNPPKKTGSVKKGSRGYFLRRSLDKFIKNNNTNPSFEEVTKNITFKDDYDKRKYKKVLNNIITNDKKYSNFKIDTADLLNKEQQKIVTDNFELPPGQKEWDFKNQKYGIKINENLNLAERIKRKIDGPQKYTIAADASKPSGWMMNAINRLYKNEIKKGVKFKDLTYQPVKKDGIIIGFKDNTAAGKGKTYYGLKKNTPEDATPWTAHGDYSRIDKFLKIAKGAQIDDPSKLLQKILDDKGITKLMGDKSVLTLNDILSHERYYKNISNIAPKKLLERQIVLHHTKGVGGDLAKAAATRDIQLLTGAVNDNVKTLEQIVRGTNKTPARKLNADEITQLKNYGAKITDFDGKVVGGGSFDPNKQYSSIEKKALEYAKGDEFNVKTVASYLERLGCGKAAGGRVFYNEGAMGLTKCAKKGQLKLENILKKGATPGSDDAILAKTILQAGGGLKNALSLRGLFGPAAIAATIGFEGGLIGYDMLTSGKTLREAFGDNLLNYALGKDYQIDPQEELFKRFKGLGYGDQQIGSIKKALDVMNTINTGAQLAMNVGQQQEDLQKSRGQPEEFMIPDDQMMADTAGQREEQNLKDARERLTAFNQNLKAVDRPGGMKKEDVLSEYFSSGKYAEDLDLFEQAQKAATVEQMQSPGPKFMGSVFPKFEERRTQTISENLPFKGANPALFSPVQRRGFTFGLAEGSGFTLGGYGKDAAKYIKEIETDHHKGYQYYKKHGGKKSFKDYVKTSMSKYFGGIAKLAGVDSGPAPESGPNPQGLQGLMKRGIKT
jgi:hypothetical protein